MKNLLKSALFLAGTAGLVGVAAQSAEAVSFTVVVNKIEYIADADNYPTSREVVYDYQSGIGSSTSKTIDLFNATQKTGTGLAIRHPGAGTYETVCVHFESAKLEDGVNSTSVTSALNTAGFTNTLAGLEVMCLGAGGTGANSVATLIGTPTAPMVPAVAAGTAVTTPRLNIEVDSSAAQLSGSTYSFTSLPTVSTVRTTNSDNADVANVLVEVDDRAAFTSTAATSGYVSGTTYVRVGAFANTRPLPTRPIASTRYKTSSSASSTVVTLYDVGTGTDVNSNGVLDGGDTETEVVLLAWIDADNDSKLDAGEYFTRQNGTTNIADAVVSVSGTTDVSTVAMWGSVAANKGMSATAIAFPPRSISITLEAATVASATAAGDCAAAADTDAYSGVEGLMDPTAAAVQTAMCGAGTGASLTVIYASGYTSTCAQSGVSTTVSLAGNLAEKVDNGGNGGDIDDTDDVSFLLANTTQFSDLNNVAFTTASTDISGSIVITNVPVCPVAFEADTQNADYDITFSMFVPSTEAVAAADERATLVTTQGTLAPDASNNVAYNNGATLDVGTLD
jgi:hypothetical protein